MANDFVGTSQFNLPDRILKQFRRDAFLRGGVTTGPEQTKAAISGGLEAGSDRLRESERIAAQLKSNEQDRDAIERQAALTREFRSDEADKQRKSNFQGGLAQAATTVAGFGILKYFKIF